MYRLEKTETQRNKLNFICFLSFYELVLQQKKNGIMDEKLEQILEKSCKIFMQFGIRSISMDDICRDLGMSKKTLYQYVENKADLVEKVIIRRLEKDDIEMEEMKKSNMNSIDFLLEVSKKISEEIKRIKPTISYDLKKYYPQIFNMLVESKRDRAYVNIKKNIEKGIKEGLYRQELNIELVAHLYVKKIEDMQNSDFFLSEDFSFEKVFEVMFENHIRGISNEKGVKYFEEKKKHLDFNL